MTVDEVVAIADQALFTVIKVAAPVLLISMAVGLIVSIFQTVTSIQEQTLTFVPKVLAIFMTIMMIGHWMLTEMVNLMINLWSDFSAYVK
ncbi:MAG: flagellar biosynthesis protein FliQ [Lachnospiraceae bacterium]|jgi:flagellar biosynthetic protein FliQ|nr:flagellar biosynthesis protein FliQ [Lachnospiraceae bacterium]